MRVSRPGLPRGLCLVVSLTLLPLEPGSAAIIGDTEALRAAAEKAEANCGSIVTWRGRAELSDQSVDSEATETRTTVADFVYNQDGDRLRYVCRQIRSSGDTTLGIQWAGLRTLDEYVRLGPFRNDDPTDFARHMAAATRDERKSESRGLFSPDFDPLIFFGVDLDPPQKFLGFYYEHREQFENVTLETAESYVTLHVGDDKVRWIYVFDLHQGGLPVKMQGGRVARGTYDLVENTYVSVKGVWLPATTLIRYERPDKPRQRTIVWSNHRVNEPVDNAEFTIDKLELAPGNVVADKQAGTQTIIETEQFLEKYGDQVFQRRPDLPAFKPVEPERPRAVGKWIFIGGNLLVLTALFVIYLRRRSRTP